MDAYWEKYRHLQSFESREAMNESVRQYERKLSGTKLAIMIDLSRHSCRVWGVSFQRVSTMAAKHEKSEITVRRHLKDLEDAGMIRRVKTIRDSGGYGSNAYVILPAGEDDKSEVISREGTESTSRTGSYKEDHSTETPINKQKEYRPAGAKMDASYVPDSVPAEFTDAVRPFFDGETVWQLWRRGIIAKKSLSLTAPLCELSDALIDAFKATLHKAKRAKVRDFYGYFYRVVYDRLMPAKRKEVAESGQWKSPFANLWRSPFADLA